MQVIRSLVSKFRHPFGSQLGKVELPHDSPVKSPPSEKGPGTGKVGGFMESGVLQLGLVQQKVFPCWMAPRTHSLAMIEKSFPRQVHRATNVLDRWGGFAPLVRHEPTSNFWSAFIHHETS